MRILKLDDSVRFYQASTSELFGNATSPVQDESTPFHPRSPYGVEGLTRGETFVSRKITRAVAGIVNGNTDPIYLGNLDARRDWGHARDYMEGVHLILRQDELDDYVLATGQSHSVREFVERAFAEIDRRVAWEGTVWMRPVAMEIPARSRSVSIRAISGQTRSMRSAAMPRRPAESWDGSRSRLSTTSCGRWFATIWMPPKTAPAVDERQADAESSRSRSCGIL